jgi:hypothetical protein
LPAGRQSVTVFPAGPATPDANSLDEPLDLGAPRLGLTFVAIASAPATATRADCMWLCSIRFLP